LSDARGGGSLTALPIIETQAGDVSAYIPTNVISITDGQIFLDSTLFYSGSRPAINAGISVSRVGGNAQIKAMKKIAGSLRLDLSQFRELQAFAKFGSDMDAETVKTISRGQRLTEVLNQPQYDPWSVQDEVMIIFAATQGFLDDIPMSQVTAFQSQLRSDLNKLHPEIGADIATVKELTPETEAKLRAAIDEFKQQWASIHGEPAEVGVVA
jgi:F-type H+-transporting ATPase subunit alpha